MKKLIFICLLSCVLCLVSVFVCFSQNSFEPGIGSGIIFSKSDVRYIPGNDLEAAAKENRMFSLDLSGFLKYNVGNYFSFAGQFDWLYKGYQKNLTTAYQQGSPAHPYLFRDAFEFIDFKLKFYYNYHLNDDIVISPNAGIGVSWLLQEKETSKYLPTDSIRYLQQYIIGGKAFYNYYEKYNWVAEFAIMVSFRLNDNINLFCEPFYTTQLNNLVKNPSADYVEYSNIKPNCWGFSIGITLVIPDLADQQDKALENKDNNNENNKENNK